MAESDRLREQESDKVQIDHLSRRMGRYNLVVAVSRRSKDIEERVDSVLVPSSGTLIYRALGEIAEGKAKVFRSNEDVIERGSVYRNVLPNLPEDSDSDETTIETIEEVELAVDDEEPMAEDASEVVEDES